MTFKQSLKSLAIVAALAVAPQIANATVFSGSANFVDVTTGNTLLVNATPNPASFTTSNLNVGQSWYDAGFITITTRGDYSQPGFLNNIFGISQSDQIALNFNFTAPSSANSVNQNGIVSQTEFYYVPRSDYGLVTWQNDTHDDINGTFARSLVTFADGAQAYLDIYDSELDGTTTARAAQIDIRLTNVKGPTAVPEPASMALLATGLIGVGMVRRRKQHAA